MIFLATSSRSPAFVQSSQKGTPGRWQTAASGQVLGPSQRHLTGREIDGNHGMVFDGMLSLLVIIYSTYLCTMVQ